MVFVLSLAGGGAGELLLEQRCWLGSSGRELSGRDVTRDLINLLCSGGAEILQELCQACRLAGRAGEGFSAAFFLVGWWEWE